MRDKDASSVGQMNMPFSSFDDSGFSSRLWGQVLSETYISALGLCQTYGDFLSGATKDPDTSAKFKAELCIP